MRRAAIRRRTQGLSSSSRNFLLSAQKKICEPFCEIRAKYFARSLNFILREAKRRFCLSAPDLPQGTCGKSECGDFDNKRAVTDRRREKTGGQPAQRACPRVFSKTQAKALVSFERFCAKKILLEKVKITLLTFSRYAAEAAHGWGECPRFFMACPYYIADRGENRSGFPSSSRKIAGDSSPRFS